MFTASSLKDHLKLFTPEERYLQSFYLKHHTYFPLDYYPPPKVSAEDLLQMALEFPKKHALSGPNELPEENFFQDSLAVKIVRHDRYMYSHEHTHAFYEVIYVLDGTCQNVVDGQSLPLETGNICIIPPKVIHSIAVNTDSLILNILLKASTFTEVFSSLLKNSGILADFFNEIIYSNTYKKYLLFRTCRDEELQELILKMYAEQENHLPHYENILIGYLFLIFGKLLQKHSDSVEYPKNYMERRSVVPKITSYIRQNCRDVTLNSCAEFFHFSPQYLSILLTKNTGKSFSALKTEARMNLASRLLCESSLTITELSDVLGYTDADYFMKVFKKYFSCTPTIYRRKHKNSQPSCTDTHFDTPK